MKKVYQKPEFQIICQDQANAKFFVASTPVPTPTGSQNEATQYSFGETQQENETVNDQGGFSF